MSVQTQVNDALWLALADANDAALVEAAGALQPPAAVYAALQSAVSRLQGAQTPVIPAHGAAAAARWRQRATREAIQPIADGLHAELCAAQLRLIDALQPMLDLVALLGPPDGARLRAQVTAHRAAVEARGARPPGPAACAELAELMQILGLPALLQAAEAPATADLGAALPAPEALAAQLGAARHRALGEALRPLEDHLLNVGLDERAPDDRGAA